MVDYKVLITTSGTGSRLGDLTKYTNKALVRVGEKSALSYIVENYPEDVEFVITLGHKGALVREFLTLAYPDRKFAFVEIPVYEGPGSSQGFSMLCAKDELQCPFIFHASDTIFHDNGRPDGKRAMTIRENTVVVAPPKNNAQYRSVQMNGFYAVRILEKGDMGNHPTHIGVVWIKEHEKFWKCLHQLWSRNDFDTDLSDAHVINAMGTPFSIEVVHEWWDVGNVEGLREARAQIKPPFVALDKVDQAVYLLDQKVVKFFADPGAVKSRVERAKILGSAVPTLLGSTEHFYCYERALGELALDVMTPARLPHFLDWCQENLWRYRVCQGRLTVECDRFYYGKTMDRLRAFKEQTGIKEPRTEWINGEPVPSLPQLFVQVDWEWLSDGCATARFHGDLHFSNILCTDEGGYKLLDWRNDFAGTTAYGDVYYDLAKINHGLIVSHDLVDKGLFQSYEDHQGVHYDLLRHHRVVECQEVFFPWLAERCYDVAKVKLLTALIFLNCAPLHHDPYNRLLYYLGKKSLYDCLKEKP